MRRLIPALAVLAVAAPCGLAVADKLAIDLMKPGAQEVATEDTLPASKIESSERNPACGQPPNTVEDIAKTMIGMGNDSIGVPLLEASKYINIDASLLNSIRAITGTMNGKSACEQLCVELPLNATNVDAEGFVRKKGDANWTKLEFFVEASIGGAMMEKPAFTKAKTGYLICSLAKNWKHDQERDFRLKINFDFKK